MKIVQVNHIFLDGGGREEHIFRISREFAKKGHRVCIVSSDYLSSGEETIGKRARKVKNIELAILKGYRTDFPPGRVQIPDLLDRLLKIDCDIIHAHGMGEQVAEQAMYVARVKGIPFVYTPHLHPWWAYKEIEAQKIWEVLQNTLTSMIIQHSSACIAVSPPQKKDIIKYTKVSGDNICTIPNGVDGDLPEVSQKEIELTFKKYGIPEVDNYVIFLGDVSNLRKGAFEAVQAFRQVREIFPNTHLILCGPWGERLKMSPRSFQLLNKMAKARYVTVIGYVEEKYKAALLTGADLLISPTAFEAFGIVLAESLYCGTPVVATRVGGTPYVVRHRKDGLLVDKQDNIPGFAKACVQLLRDKERAKKMGENGRKRVKRMFIWEKTAERTLDLYKRLIKNNRKKK